MKPYFPAREGDPPPLRAEVRRKVRFQEVDSIGIVWHGRYAGYFEDARDALGEQYGIGYMDFYENGILVPIKQLHADFHRPLRLKDEVTVEATLHYSDAARINHAFVIRDREGAVATTGYTVQMMLDKDRNLCMIPPPFYEAFLARWREGRVHP
jgi:acyl-CoA thioester hydrolase